MGVVQNSIDIQKIIEAGGDPEIAERVAELEAEIGDENSGIIKDIDDLQEANALIMTSVSAIKTTADSAKAMADRAVLWSEAEGYVGKNLIFSVSATQTVNGVTFTNNADGSVTVQTEAEGASDNAGFVFTNIVANGVIKRPDLLSGKTYIMSGCPASGSENTYYLQWFHYDGSNVIKDTGNGAQVITPDTQSMSGYNNIAIRVQKDTIITEPVVFYPMLRLASIEDGTYEQHLPNNNELLPISTLKNITSASSDFASFKTAVAAL